MPRRSSVDGATAPNVARACNVRRHVAIAASSNEVGSVVSLVGAKRNVAAVRKSVDQGERRLPFGITAGNRERRLRDQTAPILHQNVPMVSEMGSLTLRFLDETRVGISAGCVGFIAPTLGAKIDGRIASAVRIAVAWLVPGPEALVPSPRLD